MSVGEINGPDPDPGPEHDAHAAPHGTFRSYTTGFVLSVILTAVPFFLVMSGAIPSPGYTAAIVLACALVQILVHMIFFLHMTPQAEGGWLLLSTVFTVVLVVITLAGSLWVLFHLNRNMMPAMGEMSEIEAPAAE